VLHSLSVPGLKILRLLALLLAAAAPGCFAATVLLRNGDRLSGEVRGVQDGKLLLETPYAGVVRIDQASIAEVIDAPSRAVPPAAPNPEPQAPPAGRSERSRLEIHAGLGYDYSADDGRDQLSSHLDSSYIGARNWDAFFTMHQVFDNAGDPGDRDNSFFAQLSLNRYLAGRLFLFPYASVVRDLDGNQNAIFARFFGGGAGWAFLRTPKQQLYFRVGMVDVDAIGAVVRGPGLAPYRERVPAAVAAVSSKVTLRRGIQIVARVQYLQPVEAATWKKVFFDDAVHIPLSKALSLDFRGYNPPNVSRPGALTIHDFKVSTGFGLNF